MEIGQPFEPRRGGLSENFSFWTVFLGFFAMLKIKSLMYKDLIFNSRGYRKSNQLLRHPLSPLFCRKREHCTRKYNVRVKFF